MKLTENQARSAVQKWLFPLNETLGMQPDKGSYAQYSTDDKIAGKLGDNRNGEIDLNSPVPIVVSQQMPAQLSWDAPPVEDPEWSPMSADEAAKAALTLTQSIPDEQAGWYYEELNKLREKALERGQREEAEGSHEDMDVKIGTPIKAKGAKGNEPMGESTKRRQQRWMKKLLEGMGDELDPRKERGRALSSDDIDDFTQEFADEEGISIEDVYGGSDVAARRAARQEKQAQSVFANEDHEEATLRQIQTANIFPNISTLSGIRKYISTNIDPHVEMWVTANKLSRLMSSFISSSKGLYLFFDALGAASTGGDPLFTPEQVLELKGLDYVADALEQAMKMSKTRVGKKFRTTIATNPAKLKELIAAHAHVVIYSEEDPEDEFSGEVTVGDIWEDYQGQKEQDRQTLTTSSLYTQIMAKIVVEPIIQRWNQEKKAGTIIMNRNMKNQLSYEEAGQWLDSAVAIWENKSMGRKRKTVRSALMGLLEFRDAQDAAVAQGYSI